MFTSNQKRAAALVAAMSMLPVMCFVHKERDDARLNAPYERQLSQGSHSVAYRLPEAAGLAEWKSGGERGVVRPAEIMTTLSRPTVTSGDTAGEGEIEAQELEPDDEYDQSEVMRAVLGGDSMLSEFWGYHKQVLKDEEQREGYRALLSNPTMLAKVREDLRSPGETDQAFQRNLKQLIEIDYLREALDWEDNPRREEILGLIEELILEDTFGQGRDTGMRYSLATVKRELYELLHDHDPARARGVVEASRGSRLEELIAFIAGDLERRHQKALEVGLYPWTP